MTSESKRPKLKNLAKGLLVLTSILTLAENAWAYEPNLEVISMDVTSVHHADAQLVKVTAEVRPKVYDIDASSQFISCGATFSWEKYTKGFTTVAFESCQLKEKTSNSFIIEMAHTFYFPAVERVYEMEGIFVDARQNGQVQNLNNIIPFNQTSFNVSSELPPLPSRIEEITLSPLNTAGQIKAGDRVKFQAKIATSYSIQSGSVGITLPGLSLCQNLVENSGCVGLPHFMKAQVGVRKENGFKVLSLEFDAPDQFIGKDISLTYISLITSKLQRASIPLRYTLKVVE